MAVVLGLFSLVVMYMSQIPPLQIGWIPEKGPGSGAAPFWLGSGMFLCCVAVFFRAWRGTTEISRSKDVFMDGHTVKVVGTSVAAIFVLLLLTTIISAYLAIFLFLMFYLRTVGNHSLSTSLAISAGTPIGIFLLFEAGMKILLPKGYLEPLFFPLYKIFVY
jgi:hypothetical protein